MKRFSMSALAVVTLVAVLPIVNSQATHVWSQDVTISIRKNGDGDRNKPKPPFGGTRPAVDVAILLDTSNSMDGLISQAKAQLWNIIQQFADAEKSGKTPVLRVAVFEYGNTNLPASEGYVRQVCQLTDDLDKVSESLFGLTTNGGDEYCGTVIQEALKRLDWSSKADAYKAIFIAGNEPFTQGSVDYQKACRTAIDSGVVVNTIHCGNYQTGVNGKWQHGAQLAEGEYLNIDQDRAVVHIKAPQDKIIIELNTELNKTYLWFGAKHSRDSYRNNQYAQDSNAFRLGGGGGRGATKAGNLYRNEGRDLVDSLEQDEKLLSQLESSSLPEEMQQMTASQRTAHVEKMAKQRAELKKKMVEMTKARDAYVAEKRQEQANETHASTLGDAISRAVRKQLKDSGFDLKQRN